MNHIGRKTIFVTAALLATIGGVLIGAQAQNPAADGKPSAQQSGTQNAPAKGEGKPKTAAEQFKNIRILKDMPADQLIPAMQFITASLGVDCEYCHVEKAFDKDDKKTKGYARHMMEMMFNINKDNFEGQRWVTCYSCHQGSPHPPSIPAITAKETTPLRMAEEETASATGYPEPAKLLDGYLAAIGGADALKKITSRVAKGNLTASAFGDQKMTVDIYAKAPDKRVSVMHLKNGESVTAYNGKVGWLSVPGRVHTMNAQESFGAKMDADLLFPVNVKGFYTKWETKPGEKIGGQETWLVVGEKEGDSPLRLYLDQKTGLLLRLVRYVDSPLGYNPTQIDYADYRSVDGVKVPYRWTVARPGNHFTVQVEQLQQNVPVDDAKFVPPPPPPPVVGASAAH
jgi:photosynthetic reaction center cytochrome c subunit